MKHERTPAATWRRAVVGGFVVLWIGAQLVLGSVALFQPRAARLGWQMYSSTTTLPEVSITRNGAEETVDLTSLVVRDRAEADYRGALVDHFCADPQVSAVTLSWRDGRRMEEPCG